MSIMNYILYGLIIVLAVFILNKLLGFVFKVAFFLVIVATAVILYRSTQSPVVVFGRYRVDNLMVEDLMIVEDE